MQDKVRNLELALSHLEAISAARIDEVITLTQREIATVKAEKESMHTTLCTARTDLALAEQMKTQIVEYQTMEELCNSEVQKLTAHVKALTDTQQILQANLEKSRSREEELQKALLNKSSSEGLTATEGGGEGGGVGVEPTREELQKLLVQSQARIADLQTELVNASNNINDLIMEIETVSSEETKAREQGGRLLKQISDSQNMQRVALEENLHLHNQIDNVQAAQKETETK